MNTGNKMISPGVLLAIFICDNVPAHTLEYSAKFSFKTQLTYGAVSVFNGF